MDGIDNKANYRSPDLVHDYDRVRRVGQDDYVNAAELTYFITQVRRLTGESGRIVDFGAGTGKLALAFAALGYDVVALDQSPAMLERLAQKAADAGLSIKTVKGDIMDGPPDERGDVAVSSRVLMHVADPDRMLAAMAASASKGVVADAPRRRSPNTLQCALRRLRGAEAYRCFDDDELLALLRRQGLTPLDATPLFALPIGLHLALGSKGLSQGLETLARPLLPWASTLFFAAAKADGGAA
jgi:SAM-dependent methyltransferase